MSELEAPGLAGRAALVTGGSRGIGAGIAHALAARGAKVILTGRDHEALKRVAGEIQGHGGMAQVIAADLTDEAAVEWLRREAERAFGPVELLAACAGGGGAAKPLVEEDVVAWRATLERNLTTAFLTLKNFLPPMYETGRGAIVMMSSSAGRQPSGASAAYAAAKSGLQSLTRQAAHEAAAHGVRVNAIAPSAIVTERLAAQPEEVRRNIARSFPLQRLGEVGDVTSATLFLLSDASSWITGTVLDVAGGRVMV